MGSDRHQMNFVDGFEPQKTATSAQIVIPSVHRFIFLRGTSNGPGMVSDNLQMEVRWISSEASGRQHAAELAQIAFGSCGHDGLL